VEAVAVVNVAVPKGDKAVIGDVAVLLTVGCADCG